jgi:NarL family two-component system response regulator LiaR
VENPIRVLVVDDHFVVRKGVCALLAEDGGIAVVGEAGDGQQAIEEARRLAPQVILMDLRLPRLDGVEATRMILAEQPEVGVVVLTSSDTQEEVLAAIEAGALGFLAKTAQQEEFFQAIRHVADGETWLSPSLTRRLLARLKPRPAAEIPEPLTQRERDVLILLARGWSNRRIAQKLNIAEITTRAHVSHILGKLGVSNRMEAALHALKSGMAGLEGS